MNLPLLKNDWYVIYTKPRHEKKIVEKLAELEIENFLPLTKVLRNWHDRKKYITMPLFPSYVFVRQADIATIHKVLKIDGVLYFVRIGRNLAVVGDDVIRSINLFVSSGVNVEVSTRKFDRGRKVIIKDGVFAGLSCEIINHWGANRVLLRLIALQCNVVMNWDAAILSEVSVA